MSVFTLGLNHHTAPLDLRGRLAFAPEQLAQVREVHTASGRHASREIPFPQWVPAEVAEQARTIGEQEALAALAAWLPSPRSPIERVRRKGENR